jgi:hypothetical protein
VEEQLRVLYQIELPRAFQESPEYGEGHSQHFRQGGDEVEESEDDLLPQLPMRD